LYDAEGVFELVNSHDHELTLDDLFEIWKPGAGEKSVEPESEENSMTASKLSEGLGLNEAGHQGLWGTLIRKSNEQPITGEGIMRMLACYEEEIRKEEKRTSFRQNCHVIFRDHLYCWTWKIMSHYIFVYIYICMYSNTSSVLSSSIMSFRW
jgi:hypothetical protein